jgi:hypothetical protein
MTQALYAHMNNKTKKKHYEIKKKSFSELMSPSNKQTNKQTNKTGTDSFGSTSVHGSGS